ncbi:putative uncharacterized protein COL25A1-DT [Plecturocebus cupreus]
MPGEFGPSKAQVPFYLQCLRQSKGDLGKFSDKDIMLLINQTLTNTEKQTALQVAERFGYELCITYSIREGAKQCPYGREAVPMDDPGMDPSDELGEWKRRHFQVCMMEGLPRTWTMPLNYTKLFMVGQGFHENPTAFLERMRGLGKDKIITQAPPDIRRKLQKQALGPDSTLEDLLKGHQTPKSQATGALDN